MAFLCGYDEGLKVNDENLAFIWFCTTICHILINRKLRIVRL